MKKIFIGSALIAILQSIMFWNQNIGISAPIFITTLTCFFLYIMQKNNKIQNKKAELLLIPIFLLSSTYFFFNNDFLNGMNFFVIPILIILMIILVQKDQLEIKGLVRKILEYVFKPFRYMKRTMNLIRELLLNNCSVKNKALLEVILKIIKALFITIPITFIVFMLLASADIVFAETVEKLIECLEKIFKNIKLGDILPRIIIGVLFFLYLSAAIIRIIEDKKETNTKSIIGTKNKVRDKITATMLLTVLNIIYLVFCILQIKSMFLGPVLDENFLYSEYAREGFFQLMIVSVINFFTILIIKNNSKQETFKENKYINSMCILMLVFTFIILLSSFTRMNLYESKYGYTVLRLLVYFILITEAILIVPTAIYILKSNIPLAKIYMIILVSMYVILNFSNMDNMIAKRNIDRYLETGKIDIYYLKYGVGTDAIPEITRLLEENPKSELIYGIEETIKEYLERKYRYLNKQEESIWEFNLSNYRAKKAIEEKL